MRGAAGGHARGGDAFFFLAVLALFFASGACALIYQITWTRQLVLLFGTTSHAVSAVLSVFFLGLGLGSLWGGRVADRAGSPLRWYGLIEIGIAAWAVFFLAAIALGEGLVVAILRAAGGARGAGVALRALLVGALLLPPVFLMGATLPLLAKEVERSARSLGRRTGILYGVNTLGAVAGCFVTGFYLVAALGYTRAILLGAALNLAAGVVALALAGRTRAAAADRGTPEAAAPRAAGDPGLPAWSGPAALAVFAATGFAGLALEVVWTRLLAIVFLGTTYAYTTMLGTLLCGLALGGIAGAALGGRVRVTPGLLGCVTALYGLAVFDFMARLPALPGAYLALQRGAGGDWPTELWGAVWLCFARLFPPAFLAGMAFPLAVRLAGRAYASLGRDVGRLYMVNTLGGVAGAVSGGFLLLPLLGAHASLWWLGLGLFAAGAALWVADPSQRPAWRAGIAVVLALGFAGGQWRLPADVNAALNVGYIPPEHRVLSVREGVEGTVVVSEPATSVAGEDRVLWINRVQATTSIERGVRMNRFQGALPLLFDRDPKRVLFMCFGSGITCGTLALSPFERIDAVEISPDVIASAPLFAKDNLGVLERPNLRVHIDDGRNFLLTTRERYDLITFEPMPLALAGVANFYTRDYYELCRARLAPGGMVSQWVPLHSLSTDVVRALVATFAGVFPECTAWFVNADLFLIGSDRPLRIDYPRLTARLAAPALRGALADAGYGDVEEVVASFLLDAEGVAAFAAGAAALTDDRPWAEFEAPRLVYAREVPDSLAALQPLVGDPLPLVAGADAPQRAALARRHASRVNDLAGLRQYYGGMSIDGGAVDQFEASLEMDPGNETARYYYRQIVRTQVERFLRWEQPEDVRRLLERAARHLPGDPVLRAAAERVESME